MPAPRRDPGFTLIELLVVIAIIAVLLAVLLPSLAGARGTARTAACLTNLRQIAQLQWVYADENAGLGPALGVPYAEVPNWALVVQSLAGAAGVGAERYSTRSILVCPEARAKFGPGMTRTYAANATGHAGLPGDPDNFDAAQAHVRFALVQRPSDACMAVDSLPLPPGPGQPPPTRTSSVIDFRQPDHIARRLSAPHARGLVAFAAFDGSARTATPTPPPWLLPLP